MSVFKALGVLLTYPSQDLVDAAPEIGAIFDAEPGLPAELRAGLGTLLEQLRTWTLLDLQERYVGTFDRTRQLSLHLFEHVHGEARDRGQAMVDLAKLYSTRAGLEMTSNELPDFLPLFCEFLSVIAREEAQAYLADAASVVEVIGRRLEERDHAYAPVLLTLSHLAQAGVDSEAVDEALLEEAHAADDFEAMDREWEEAPVTFAPGAAHDSCGVNGRANDLVPLKRKEA